MAGLAFAHCLDVCFVSASASAGGYWVLFGCQLSSTRDPDGHLIHNVISIEHTRGGR